MWTKVSDRFGKLAAFHAGWSNWVWGNGRLNGSVQRPGQYHRWRLMIQRMTPGVRVGIEEHNA